MRIFEATKRFPPEERYALTSQIRRSSRSICLNRREAWAKRMYPAHFLSKLTDCDGECNETECSLEFAKDCKYVTSEEFEQMSGLCSEVGRMLGAMIRNPSPFCTPPTVRK